ncbi:type VI secretion system protein TssA [Paraburkholderia acidisoli]|uniref:type VI secretion system protein TssA n=1 Tax=Paraburkholderia acidisoli TaxID=2571748 RepID=UPI0018EEDD94|nr:type VI secretion system ImpA family N-terminal domain-containing protein [Paraburkholderia acidisoli]
MTMNDRNNGRPTAAARPRAQPAHDWLMPVTAESPCGADLEYDPEFIVLASKVAARTDAQYGDFVGVPEPVNWGEIDRECRRLMMRSKDIRLAIVFTRCRTRLTFASGLAEGLRLLASWLTGFPDAIHPQLSVDADRDAALEIRMNALQALTDTDGLLADVRDIALTKSSVTRLQLRDIERAFAHPRSSDALAPESVSLQLDDLCVQQPALFASLDEALAHIEAIEVWARTHLEGYEPDFTPLRRILKHIAGRAPLAVAFDSPAQVIDDDVPAFDVREMATGAEANPQEEFATSEPRAKPADAPVSSREAALNAMRTARHWFEQHEPSSPIPVLLRKAEHCVGKRYSELVHAVPSELIAQWESE